MGADLHDSSHDSFTLFTSPITREASSVTSSHYRPGNWANDAIQGTDGVVSIVLDGSRSKMIQIHVFSHKVHQLEDFFEDFKYYVAFLVHYDPYSNQLSIGFINVTNIVLLFRKG